MTTSASSTSKESNMATSHLKFRPVLTLEQIKYIASMLDQSKETHPIEASIRRVIVPLLAKIEVGAINPAYKLSETHAIKQAESTLRQRYENDLMSPEEAAIYEAKILGV